ncbi:helix-turn-helix domain-containing protein [Streptomyces sp. R302]|uniref:helix-turn-helix domain-containing protein n=1 Tax=unclassified Streptomyces TaxID=2593676 RepID=UPI00145EEC71|nr:MULTISPECIES: helix-turn-helix domain-containing protein [unclassified Streptomyces]NML55074.1 helix-turn-helix domain-containing protein [Streptomyces sp. R301]NML83896.1 helix-turn-helix domain-containing protein [Streptomyces sp. R302]
MSLTRINAALDAAAELPSSERLVLVLLARCADAEGLALMSLSHLAHQARLSPSGVARALHRLADRGLVQRHRPGDREGIGSAYRVLAAARSEQGTAA